MKLKAFLFGITCVVILFSSCTVEKRLHKKGYYVAWRTFPKIENKKASEDKKIKSHDELSETNTTPLPQENEVLKTQESGLSSSEKINELAENTAVKVPAKSLPAHKKSQKPKANDKKEVPDFLKKYNKKTFKKDTDPIQVKKESNKLAFIGLGLTLGSLILFFLIIPALFVNAVALRQINREPWKYNNKAVALVSYIVSVVLIGLSFTVLAAIILLYSFEIVTLIWIVSIFLILFSISLIIINV